MQIIILGSPEGKYCLQLKSEAERRGHRCDVASFEGLRSRLRNGSELLDVPQTETPQTRSPESGDRLLSLENYDVCIVRTMPPGSLEQVVFRMDFLWSLEAAGVELVNPAKGMECAVDKYLSLARCRHAGIRVPETTCCETAEAAMEQFRFWNSSAVVKPLFGSEGRGILHLTEAETARRVFRAIEQIQSVIYLQKYISAGHSDIRVMVVGGNAVGAIRRTGTADFRANCSQSGVATSHDLTEEEQQLAIRACAAVGVSFAGVDLIYDENGQLYLLEVNGSPGWSAFSQTTGINVAALLFDWLER